LRMREGVGMLDLGVLGSGGQKRDRDWREVEGFVERGGTVKECFDHFYSDFETDGKTFLARCLHVEAVGEM